MVGTSDLRFLWTDLATGIEWKEARRAVLQAGQEEDGWRKVMVVNRLHPGRPGANCRVIRPGDKLVTIDTGGGPRIVVGLGLKHLRRMLEPVSSGVLTLEFLNANDVCGQPAEISDVHVQRPYTYAVELDLDDDAFDDEVQLQVDKPSTPGHVSFPPLLGISSDSRPSSRPKTTSWACTDDPQDPRSTRPLNANRFERLLFTINCKLREKAVYHLLSDSYELDKPQTPAGPNARPRACYRLRRWWSEEEQEAVRSTLADLTTWGHSSRIEDVMSILEGHVAASALQYPAAKRQMEMEAEVVRLAAEAEQARQEAVGLKARAVAEVEKIGEEEGGQRLPPPGGEGGRARGRTPGAEAGGQPRAGGGWEGGAEAWKAEGEGSRVGTGGSERVGTGKSAEERGALAMIESLADDLSTAAISSVTGAAPSKLGQGSRPATGASGAERGALAMIETIAEDLSSAVIAHATQLFEP